MFANIFAVDGAAGNASVIGHGFSQVCDFVGDWGLQLRPDSMTFKATILLLPLPLSSLGARVSNAGATNQVILKMRAQLGPLN